MNQGASDEREEHRRDGRRDGAERHVAEDVQPPEPARSRAAAGRGARRARQPPSALPQERGDDALGADAARGLDEDDVARARTRSTATRAAASASPASDRVDAARAARRARWRRARPPHADRASATPASTTASASASCSRCAEGPSSFISPRTATRRRPRAALGQRGERGAHASRGWRCRCRRARVIPPARRTCIASRDGTRARAAWRVAASMRTSRGGVGGRERGDEVERCGFARDRTVTTRRPILRALRGRCDRREPSEPSGSRSTRR